MHTLLWLVSESFVSRLAATLLHFLWQGSALGLLVWSASVILRGAPARCRYGLNLLCLLMMAACLPSTYWWVSGSTDAMTSAGTLFTSKGGSVGQRREDDRVPPLQGMAPSVDAVVVAQRAESPNGAMIVVAEGTAVPNTQDERPSWLFTLRTEILPAWSSWIVSLYLVGVTCALARLLLGVWGAQRLRALAVPIDDMPLLATFQQLAQRIGLRVAPTIAWCEQVSVPVVVGLFKPMILLPLAVLSQLSPEQLHAVVLHELSHIRRLDPLVNLLQRVVEALLFFHPLVWFVSRRVSLERELAADDMVVSAGWDRLGYADALVQMAEAVCASTGLGATRQATLLAATGKNRSELALRVMRLLDAAAPPPLALSRTGTLVALSVLLASGLLAWSQVQPPVAPEKPGVAEVTQQPDQNSEAPKEQKDDVARLLERIKDPLDPTRLVLSILDTGPVERCRELLKQLDDAGDRRVAAAARERLAQRWQHIASQPVASFVRAPQPRPDDQFDRGETVGIQTQLDGVWSEGKGNAGNWSDWIRRKQSDYRVDRLKLLFEAAQAYRQVDDSAGAERALVAGLAGHEFMQTELKALIAKHWPVAPEPSAEVLGTGPQAWTLVNFLEELVAARRAQGKIDQAIDAQSRLTLAHFLLSWRQPSNGPTKQARELWSLIRQRGDELPPLFWFNMVDDKTTKRTFDLSGAGRKGQPLTYHHENLAAAPSWEFDELTIRAETRGHRGLLDCYRINSAGKYESIGLLLPTANGEIEQVLTKKVRVPRGTNLVQFMVAGEEFEVGEVTVQATLVKAGATETPGDGASNKAAPTLRTPTLLLPDHYILLAVAFDREERELVTVSTQSVVTIRRWDIAAKKLISEVKLQGDKPARMIRPETTYLSGDCRRVVMATDAYVGIWETATGKLLTKLPIPKLGMNDTVRKLSSTADLSVIVGTLETNYSRTTRIYDALTAVWDGKTGQLVRTNTHPHQNDLIAISLSADGKRLATTNGSGARIWDVQTGELLLAVTNDNSDHQPVDPAARNMFADHVWSVRLSPNGKQLAVGDTFGVKLIDATSGVLIRQLAGPYRYSSSASPELVFSPDGRWLARLGTREGSASKEGADDAPPYVVPIWSTQTERKQWELVTPANTGVFSADGQRFVVGFSELQQAVAVWQLAEAAGTTTKPDGPGPESRQDKVDENGHYRGKTAVEFVDKFQPTWGETKAGIQYGIALTKPQDSYRPGERVPLAVFFRNASDRPRTIDMSPDYHGNAPKLVDAQGQVIHFETVTLLGTPAHYVEPLEPGEVVGPFYCSVGLGENPRPGLQPWHPFWTKPRAGQYQLTHTIAMKVKEGESVEQADVTTGVLNVEIAQE